MADRVIEGEGTRIEEHGAIAVIKLNRPERMNAFGDEMTAEINAYLHELISGDYRIRAIILTQMEFTEAESNMNDLVSEYQQ